MRSSFASDNALKQNVKRYCVLTHMYEDKHKAKMLCDKTGEISSPVSFAIRDSICVPDETHISFRLHKSAAVQNR